MSRVKPHRATFRFYEELNNFLQPEKRKVAFEYRFDGSPSIKDAIESMGIPHTEIDLILVNSVSVAFNYHLKDGDYVSVYPVFESLDISNLTHLRPKPLRETKFILDVHLGKLAREMRLLGIDTVYENYFSDIEIIERSLSEKRAILTRDTALLMNGKVTHGYLIRSTNYMEQLDEVLRRFDLYKSLSPFTRCMVCNGIIENVPKEEIAGKLEPKTLQYYDEFYKCGRCGRIYWKGSHYQKMKDFVNKIMK